MNEVGYLSKKDIYKSVVVVSLILFSMILRTPFITQNPSLVYLNRALIYPLIYFGLFIVWALSLKRRIIDKQIFRLLMSVVGLLVFWFMIRTIKYIFVPKYTDMDRWLWYLYYFPILLIPQATIYIACSLGKQEAYKFPKWLRLFFIPTLFLIGLVLTNDLHQLVFKFPEGGIWTSFDYQYGTLYWHIWAWIAALFLASLSITIVKSRLPHHQKFLYLPFIPYVVGLLYSVFYKKYIFYFSFVGLNDMTAVFSLIIIAIFESLIQVGLIRSNSYYEELFYASDLSAKIINKQQQVCYETAPNPKEDKINFRKSSFDIAGGKIHWLEDISEINGLINQLQELNQDLSEENNLLQAELELKERKIMLEEHARLYDRISKAIAPQLNQVKKVLSEHNEKPILLEKKLQKITVLGTYIKRRSNLLILKEDKSMFSAKELEYCLRESLEAIHLNGIACSMNANCRGKVQANHLLLIYDLFEEIVEALLPSMNALFVNLNIVEGKIKIKLQTNIQKETETFYKLDVTNFKNTVHLIEHGGDMQIKDEDENIAFHIELPKVGES